MKKKVLSLIISLAVVLAMIPAAAYGAEDVSISVDGGLPMEYTVLGQDIEKTYTVKYDPDNQCILTAIVTLDETLEKEDLILEDLTSVEMMSSTKMKVTVSKDTIAKLYEGKLTDGDGKAVAPQKYFVIYAGIFDGKTAKLEDTSLAKCTVFEEIVKGVEDASKIRWSYSKPLVYSGKTKTLALKNVPAHVKVDKSGYKAKKVGTYTASINDVSSISEDYVISGYPAKTEVTWKIVPAKSAVTKVVPGKKKLTVKMGTKVASTGGTTYQIAYKQKGTSKWKYTTTTKQSKVIKKLKKGKRYYVKVRAYKKIGTDIYYGAWSKQKLSRKIK